MLARADPAFDGPMILLQDVIEVLHGAVLAVLLQNTFGFELHNRRRVSGVLVGVDDPRVRMVRSPKALTRKRSAAAASRLAESKKSIVAPLESTARYK